MTNAHHAADAHTMVECPKCAGTGHHRQWAHIVGGDCFLCGAAGRVTKAAAGRWLAGQVDKAPHAPVVGVQTRDENGTVKKTVNIEGLGLCRFTRWSDGVIFVGLEELAYVDNFYGEEWAGGLWLAIEVVNGRVVVANDKEDGTPLVCNGLNYCLTNKGRPALPHVLAHLQKALKN